jgi:DUF917 family protein
MEASLAMNEFKPGEVVHEIPDELDGVDSLDDLNTEAVVVQSIEDGRLYYVKHRAIIRESDGTSRTYAYPLHDGVCRTKREAIQAAIDKELEYGRGLVEQAEKVQAMLAE